jgi:hypothetical protein
MSNIVELAAGDLAFEPHDIEAMSAALHAVCGLLNIRSPIARELIALRIIDLAHRGERSSAALQERVLADTQGGSGC